MKKDRRIEQDLKELRSVTPKELLNERRSAERYLAKSLKEGNVYAVREALNQIALRILTAGQKAIAEGDPKGWNQVCEFCWARISNEATLEIPSSERAGSVAPSLLFRLAVEGWTPALKPVLSWFDSSLKKAGSGARGELHLAFFTAHITKQLSGNAAKLNGPKGALATLTAQLEGTLTNRALVEVCEFQLKNGGQSDRDGMQFAPLMLIPMWWFAIERLRRQLGLETAKPEHPLFDTPFALLPPKLTFDAKKSKLLKLIADAPTVKN